MSVLTIGQLARQAGVAVETVRFYERRGLLEKPSRRPSGYRQYLPESVSQLRFILVAKQLGFSLREVQELLHLRGSGIDVCPKVRNRIEVKIATVAEKINSLEQSKKTLEALLEECRANRLSTECPLLENLNRQAEPCLTACGCCDLDDLS
jgi:MerR family mercuric resistance operon transcriptional regulator